MGEVGAMPIKSKSTHVSEYDIAVHQYCKRHPIQKYFCYKKGKDKKVQVTE